MDPINARRPAGSVGRRWVWAAVIALVGAAAPAAEPAELLCRPRCRGGGGRRGPHG